MNSDDRQRPALGEPLLWLVIGLPLAAVIAGIATLIIAIRAGGSEALPDPVRRTAQVQQIDLAPDRTARDERLRARLQLTDGNQLRLGLDGSAGEDVLLLQLIHPGDAAKDRQVALTRDGADWVGDLSDADMRHDWRLQLSPASQRWRLHGRWSAEAEGSVLAPALGPE